MIDNFPTKPLSQSQSEQLARLEADYKTIFVALREKRDNCQRMFAEAEEERATHWREKRDEAQRAIDALVRVKDIAKVLLLERNLSVAEEWKQEELIQDVEFRPVRLNY